MTVPVDHYTVTTAKAVPAAAAAVMAKARDKGFEVLEIHDLQLLLAAKGFEREPAILVEMCYAPFGHQLLAADPLASLMMPCRIAVYIRDGQTYISALRPRLWGDLFPPLAAAAEEEDARMRAVVDEAC